MTKRVAALLALVSFAVAWLIGVARGQSPLTRVENAGLALVAAFAAGLGIGVALERIVLWRLSEAWRERAREEAGRDPDAPPAAKAAASAKSAAAAKPAAPAAARETVPAEAAR